MFPRKPGLAALLVVACLAGCGEATSKNEGCAGPCSEGLVCDVVSGTCVPAPPPDVKGCGSHADCAPPTGVCDIASKKCVQCLEPAHCPSGICQAGACLPVPERCGVAQVVEVSQTPTLLKGTTAGRANDTSTSCAVGEGAPDLVYEVRVPFNARLTAKVRPADGSALVPVLELRSDCAATTDDARQACAWAWSEPAVAELSADLSQGTYFLWVDADAGTSGAFELEIVATPALAGESCLAPKKLLTSGGVVEISGDTSALGDDYRGVCGGAGPEEVYELVVTQTRRVQITVTPTSSNFRPVVYLRRPGACASNAGSAQLDCGGLRAQATAVVLDLPSLEPGTYYLFVDGDFDASFMPSRGSYQLKVEELSPLPLAPNDSCGEAQEVTLPEYGSVLVSGDTTSALSDATSACGGSAPDVVYRFTLPSPRYVTARVTPETGSAFAPVLYLRSACASEAPEDLLGCNAATQYGGAAGLAHGNLPAGTYFLWVDGLAQSRGRFALKLEAAAPLPPPANDSCAAPAVLKPTLGTVAVSGTTLGASDDYQGCEVPAGSPSPDVLYELNLPQPSSLSIEVQAPSGSALRPVVSLNKGVCAAPALSDRLFCAWGDPYTPDRVVHTVGALAAGTYFVWVDGDLTSAGPFSLKASVGAPVPAPINDSCPTALAISTPAAVVAGDTRSANDTTFGYCLPWLTGSGEGAGDVAYTFTLSAPRTVTITATPDPTDGRLFRPALYVRGATAAACSSVDPANQRGCAVAPSIGSSATLTLQNLPAGTYTAWVDGASQTSGKFTLTVQ